jgi:hypothetical protein
VFWETHTIKYYKTNYADHISVRDIWQLLITGIFHKRNDLISTICLLQQDGMFGYKMAEHLYISAETVGNMSENY